MCKQKAIIFFFLLLVSAAGWAQRRVDIKQAGTLRSGSRPDGTTFDRLINDVILVHGNTTIYCDSAYHYSKLNSVEAFGRVRITEGDSITVTGRKLEYDGNTRVAKLRNNVIFTKLATATLYTDYLDYDRNRNLAYYYNNGKLVDSINVLTSNKGYYNVNTNLAAFKKDVDVQNPDYNMKSDSLQYNSRSKVIYFVTTTTVTDKEGNTFIYEDGEYNTSMRQSILGSGTAETPEYQLKGARYSLDDIRKVYHVSGNVVMTSKKENLIIYGQQADYYKNRGITKVYDHAYLAKVTDNNDTLFMRADTLVSIDNEDPAKKRLLAYHHVQIYKSDLQGVADSVEYRAPDSTIYFYQHPVLWSQGNQMTADSISMLIENNTVSRIFLVANAFVISQDTLVNYNQIKGRDMTAEVKQGKINRVYVDGNAESLYFVLDEKTMAFTGMNKMVCSSILIRFKDGQVDNMTSYQQPDAHFIPPHELSKDQRALKGFMWLNDKRPTRAMVVANPVADTREKKPDAAAPKTQPKQALPQKPRRRSNSDKQ